jgi:hypothetical protein
VRASKIVARVVGLAMSMVTPSPRAAPDERSAHFP